MGEIKMKNLKIILAAILLSLITSGAFAYTIKDTTKVEVFYMAAPSTTPGVWVDYIDNSPKGANFNTFGANLSGNTFTIFTNWHPDKDNTAVTGVYTADLFIWDYTKKIQYAIRLDPVNQGRVLTNLTRDLYNTSQDWFKGNQNVYYGGLLDQWSANGDPVAVWAKDVSPFLTNTTVTWYKDVNDPDPDNPNINKIDNKVEVDLTGLNLGNHWAFVWGTGTCGNDAFAGEIRVPEPGMMLLLGAGLIGLTGLRRKFKK